MSTQAVFIPSILRTRGIVPLLTLLTLVLTGTGMVSPVLSLYARAFGVSGALVGMMVTLYGVGRLLANLPAGVLSERYGRKLFLVLGPAIIGVGAVGAAITPDFTAVLFWRFVQGVGSGIYMTVSATVLVRLASAEERGRALAIYQGALLLGTGIGPAIGGFLANHWGLAAPFWAFGVVGFAGALFAFFGFSEPPAEPEGETGASGEKKPRPSARQLLFQLPFLSLCIITFGTFFTRTGSQWIVIPLIGQDSLGLSVDAIGVALSVVAVANFAMLAIVGPAIDRFGAGRILVHSTVLTGVALVLIAFAHTQLMFWVAIALLGVAAGFSGPSVSAAVATLVPRSMYGPAIGTQRAVGDIGYVIAPILVGFMYDLPGFGSVGALVFNAAIMVAASLLFRVATAGAPKA
jgi:MFS family permease